MRLQKIDQQLFQLAHNPTNQLVLEQQILDLALRRIIEEFNVGKISAAILGLNDIPAPINIIMVIRILYDSSDGRTIPGRTPF